MSQTISSRLRGGRDSTSIAAEPPTTGSFKIVTTGDKVFRKGQPAPYGTFTLTDFCYSDLESYEQNGAFLDLRFEDDYVLSLPISGIRYIAQLPAA